MLVNFLVVDFRLESKLYSSYCLRHTAMMWVYASDQTFRLVVVKFRVIQEALCEALCRFAHLWSESCKRSKTAYIM